MVRSHAIPVVCLDSRARPQLRSRQANVCYYERLAPPSAMLSFLTCPDVDGPSERASCVRECEREQEAGSLEDGRADGYVCGGVT